LLYKVLFNDLISNPRKAVILAVHRRAQARHATAATEYRRCFTLRHMERRSYNEIAAIVHLPPGTVKSHVHRAKLELRRMLRPVRPSASADPVRTA